MTLSILKIVQESALGRLYISSTTFAQKYLFSCLVLFMRIWIAEIFWYSGLTKISSWEATIYLFKHEYKVPFISPEIAALLGTSVELSTPILLVFGFMTRFAAMPMLFMTAVIQFTYLDRIDHMYWAILLGVVILYGPGLFSVDHLIRRKI
jgi:putative oxidoreductase